MQLTELQKWFFRNTRAVSIWQPWASLLAADLKNFETRPWDTTWRGFLLVCAAQQNSQNQRVYFQRDAFREALGVAGYSSFDELPLGAALGLSRIVNAMPCNQATAIRDYVSINNIKFGHWADDRFAWEIQRIQRFPEPIEITGRQGLFHVPEEIMPALIQVIDWEEVGRISYEMERR